MSLNGTSKIAAPVAAQEEDSKRAIEGAVSQILINVGEDPEREGLQRTPERIARM